MFKKATISILLVLSIIFSASPAFAAKPFGRVLVTPEIYKTYGPGISYPDKTDPTKMLPASVQRTFQCIRRYESRNHRIDGDASTGEGWYQLTPSTWHSAAIALHFPSNLLWSANLASGNQQSEVAVWYYERNKRFGVQWYGDAFRCPGVFFFS